MVPCINAAWQFTKRDFGDANIMTTGWTRKKMYSDVQHTAGPKNPLHFSHDYWHFQKVFKRSDGAYQIKSIAWKW
jgi:hypothetical protein